MSAAKPTTDAVSNYHNAKGPAMKDESENPQYDIVQAIEDKQGENLFALSQTLHMLHEVRTRLMGVEPPSCAENDRDMSEGALMRIHSRTHSEGHAIAEIYELLRQMAGELGVNLQGVGMAFGGLAADQFEGLEQRREGTTRDYGRYSTVGKALWRNP
jgi:hypothetical protein